MMLRITSTIPPTTGRDTCMLTLVTWPMMIFVGMIRISVTPIPISPANAPMIKVSALNTWPTFRLDAPMARRIPISFRRSSTLM